MIFWYILAGVLAAVIAASVIVIVSNLRHRHEIGPSEEASALEGAAPDEEPAGEQPAQEQPVATDDVGEPATDHDVETVEEPSTRMARLRRRLANSNNALARGIANLLSSDHISDETWDDFEATLITSDLGVGPTQELVATLKSRLSIDGVKDPDQARSILRDELITLVNPDMDRSVNLEATDGNPAVVLVVGVNGTGKTTTVGKIARALTAQGKTVLLGAADTFRAAAAEQLTTWGDKIGVETIRGPEGADPASVAFEAVKAGKDRHIDVVLVDTAGRLHNKTNLMDELGKVARVVSKVAPITETLLVLDATTGQNGLAQARVFSEVVGITGIVLTKLDGSAKGGIVVAVQRELGVPVKYIGLGEGADDLAPFDVEQFVDGLLGQ